MKNKFVIVLMAVLLGSLVNAKENSVKSTPEKPKAGDEITIMYNPVGTSLASAKKIEMIYSIYSAHAANVGIQETHILDMNKAGDSWNTVIKTSSQTELIAVKFISEDISDNNELKGYFIRFYDEQGNETDFSKLGYATALISWPNYNIFCDKDHQKGLEIMKMAFAQNPKLKQLYFGDYLSAVKKVTPDSLKPSVLKKELAEAEMFENLSDQNYYVIGSNYSYLKMTEKADAIIKQAVKKNPSGSVAYHQIMKNIDEEKDLEKKKQIAIEAEKVIKELPSTTTTSFRLGIFQSILKSGDYKMLKEWWEYNKTIKNEMLLPEGYQFVSLLLKENKGLDLSLEICKFIEANWSDSFTENKLQSYVRFFTEKHIQKLKARDHAEVLRQYADVLYMLGNKDEAFTKYELGFSIYDISNFDEKVIADYAKKIIDYKKYDNKGSLFETAVKRAIQLDGLQEALKTIYVNKNGKDEGFEDYLAKLLREGRTALETKLKKQMINQPAVNFTLFDLNGKEVSLSDYKGKVVVVDFWATWCVPCKESFPAMQKTVDKYRDDKNVVFLFVNTWQTEVDKKKNAENFIKEKKYTFHVLLDTANKVITDYKVSGIPTKFVIDGKGNIRFNSVGGKTGDLAVEELSFMIELAKK